MRLTGFLLLSAAAAAQQYVVSTYAGGVPPPTPAPGLSVPIGSPWGVATDAAGNVYFTSTNPLSCVFKLDRNGIVTRIAGNARPGYSGDGGPATNAQLNISFGGGVAVDGAGNLFIADANNRRIRRVSPDGIITTVAGNGASGSSGDGGPAASARLDAPFGLAADRAGNLFIADAGSHRIRKVSPSGIITTVAGGGTGGLGDGGAATSAQLNTAWGVAVDSAGNLFIADTQNHRIRRVSPDGTITTVAGNGAAGFSGDGGPATSAVLGYPIGVAVDGAGNLFINGAASAGIRKVSPDGTITTVAEVRSASVAVDGAGNMFIPDLLNYRIRRVSPSGTITTVAGNGTCCSSGGSGDDGPATGAHLSANGLAVDGVGNLFIADRSNQRIRKVSRDGTITTVAQVGGLSVAVDGAGDLFIETGDHRIRKLSPEGIITTAAGNGTQGFSGDGGPATSAALRLGECQPPCGGLAVDGGGNLYIADTGNHRIRKVSPDGIITTVAGGGFAAPGDDGPATGAQLSWPVGVAVDGAGNLLIAESEDSLRKVSPSGIITTVARGFSHPTGVAVDRAGNVFFTTTGEYYNDERVRKVSPSGIITTVAGAGWLGTGGDGGPATTAALGNPSGVAVDAAGNVYVADWFNSVVRILRPTDKSVLISAVVDAASQRADPVSPGKIVVIYGAGLGPAQLVQNQLRNSVFGTEHGGTSVSFNGIAAPILYTSATQVAVVVPYAVTGTTAQVTVSFQGEVSADFTVPVAASAPSIFTVNQTGAGQAAAINAADGTVNTAANPVKIGDYISLWATGEGQTEPAGVDGRIGSSTRPMLPVAVTVGGIPATVQYAGGAPGQVPGLMQVNVQIPSGVQPGGYVPVVLQVGDRNSNPAVWIAVSGN